MHNAVRSAAPSRPYAYSTERVVLAAVLLAYLALGVGFALRTPAWQAPDEPAHYNYVAQIAANGCCPVIEIGDWQQAYLDTLRSAHFRADLLDRLDTLQYEDHQPPLYYLLEAPVYALTGGSLIALRLLSVIIGAGVVLCAFGVGKAMLPDRPQIALGAAAFVAFLPQHVAVLSAVDNDGLSELFVGLTLLATVVYLKDERVRAWQLGLFVGIGMLVKLSALFLVGLVPLAMLARWWMNRRTIPFAHLVREWALFALPVLVLGGVWWARNLSVYGVPDVFGLRAHNSVVVGQPRTAELIEQVGFGEYMRRAAETTFNSFWGQFGWMALPLPAWTYALIAGLLAVVIVGLLIDVTILRQRDKQPPPGQRAAWGLLALTVVLGFAQYAYYNTEFQQFQGRYLYPILIPVGLWMALGLDAWRRLLFGRVAAARWLAVAGLALLFPLDVYLLWRVIPLLNP
jgi:hypothetical protein